MLPPRTLVLLSLAVAAACARHSGDVAAVGQFEVPRFETRTEVETGTAYHSDYCVADFDGDGVLDMAVISLTGELRVMIGNGTTFALGQAAQIDGLPIWMDSADFDGDGDRDLVIVRSDANSTGLWLNDGNGTFTPGAALAVGEGALAVAVGDLDDDGHADVTISRPEAPEIVVALGDGAGGFWSVAHLSMPGGGTAFNLAVGDATRDGTSDLIVADPDQSRLVIFPGSPEVGLGGAESLGNLWFQLAVPGSPVAVSLGDLNGDLLDDLAVSAWTAERYVVITEILLPEGTGPQYSYASFDIPVPARPSESTIADVTGDGLPDLVACLGFNAAMCIAPRAQGEGGVGPLVLLDASGLPLRPFVGDFDGNGRGDLFALSGLGSRVNLWLAKDGGTLAGARGYQTGLPLATWIEGGDFDGDGDLELATASRADARITIMAKDGEGRLVPEATVDVGAGVFQLEAADLDGDGRWELFAGVPGGLKLLRNTSTPGTYVFEVLPGPALTIGSGDHPFGVALADFDGDSHLDIAACDFGGGGLHLVRGTADPFVFGDETVLPLADGPIDVVAADFTGDGLPDLAVSRSLAGDIVLLRNEAGVFDEFLTLDVGDLPNYLVTSDFDRDGRADLVVSNAGSGTVSVLFGEATGFVGQDFVAGSAPTALLARDLTRDGIPDILIASLVSGDFRVLVGDGAGSFPLLPTYPGTLGASDAVLQDMDGDQRPELLITSLITNRVSLVQNVSQPVQAQ